MTGPAGGAPQMPGVQIADLAGGGLWGAVGILAALLGARATGEGRHVDISMTEGAMALLLAEMGNHAAAPTRGRESLNGALACYGVYRAGDGRYLSLGALEPKFWGAFNEAIGRRADVSELIASPEVQERVRGEIQAILETRTRDEWAAAFAGKDVCCEPVLELSEVPGHPLHRGRKAFFQAFGQTQLRTPVGEPALRRPAPSLGEHTAEVLADAGLSAEEIAAL